jgi:hypothetical protein
MIFIMLSCHKFILVMFYMFSIKIIVSLILELSNIIKFLIILFKYNLFDA